MSGFLEDLQTVLNKYSAENASDTPDFILARYLMECLLAYDGAVQQREQWYGRDGRPSMPGTPLKPKN